MALKLLEAITCILLHKCLSENQPVLTTHE